MLISRNKNRKMNVKMNWNNIKQRMGKQELSESTGIEIFEEQL
jgi:hypothetical protein